MSTLTYLRILARVLWAELFPRRRTDPWTPERMQRAVRNALRARRFEL